MSREAIQRALGHPTLVDCLRQREREPERSAFVLETLDAERQDVSAGALIEGAERYARGLAELGVGPGDRVLLVLPTSVEFVLSYWGALLAAATPVPAYPPARLSQLESFRTTLGRLVATCRAPLVVAPELLREVLGDASAELGPAARLVTPEEVSAAGSGTGPLPEPPAPEDLALIQFSSGSTGDPKGVCLTHANLLANARAFMGRMEVSTADLCVTWLPLYHDMGLIGTMIAPVATSCPLVLIPPTDFLRRPAFWLESLGRNRATISVAPQFAFSLCTRKVDPGDLPGIDLSPLRILLNGAEPIFADAIRDFEEHFAPLGLRRGVVTPCYGLAEATLAASMRSPGTMAPVRAARLDADARDAAEPPRAVSVGPAMDGLEIRIRGRDGAWLRDGEVGEICVRGPSVSGAILTAEGERPATDAEGWLATRDLGFLAEGELHVTGRIKDLIILGGRNLYPQDVEAAAAELPGFRPGRIAAFGVSLAERTTQALVVVAETNGEEDDAPRQVVALRRRLRESFGVLPWDTVLLRRGQLPLTSSGKIRRAKAREEYEAGALREVVYRARSGAASRAAATSSARLTE